MKCRWDERQLMVEIADRGQGMPQEFKELVGKVPFTTKAEGHGLGLLLAHAIIQRLDGVVQISERAGGGAVVNVELSLEKLLIINSDDD